MDKMAQEIVAGDIFNHVLIGHGALTGIILGGNKFLTTYILGIIALDWAIEEPDPESWMRPNIMVIRDLWTL